MSWPVDLVAAIRRRWQRILARLKAFDWRFDGGKEQDNGIPVEDQGYCFGVLDGAGNIVP